MHYSILIKGIFGLLTYYFLILMSHFYLLAVPAAPVYFEITQPDGKKFEAILKGDEWFNWIETRNQQVIIQNKKTGYYEYAILKKEGNVEMLKPSGKVVEVENTKKTPDFNKLESITRQDLKRLWQKAIQKKTQYLQNKN